MELVSPRLISKQSVDTYVGHRVVPYDGFRSMAPIRVDSYLNMLDDGKNIELFKRYVRDELKLVSIVRSNPDFRPRENFPTRVLLEMTSRCNLNCTMCPSRHLERPKIDMDPAPFKRCVDELDSVGIDGIWIFNVGESILHPNFAELLA